MMTEAEVLRQFKAQPSELGLKVATTVSEENKNLALFPVGLDGLDYATAASIRKMRLYQETSVLHNEFLLQTQFQIDAAQGRDLYDHAASLHTKSREGPLKKDGKILHAQQLASIAEEVEERKRGAMMAMGGSMELDDDDEDEEDGFGYKSSAPAGKVAQAPSASALMSSLGSRSAKAPSKTACKSKASKKRAAQSDDDEMDDLISETTGQKADLTSLAQRDPEMAKVMAKHATFKGGRESPCFSVLQVSNFLRNMKYGKALQGVAWYEFSGA